MEAEWNFASFNHPEQLLFVYCHISIELYTVYSDGAKICVYIYKDVDAGHNKCALLSLTLSVESFSYLVQSRKNIL